jgi:hypothetical protein
LRSPAGKAADRRGQFSTDIEPAFPESIESLRRGLAGKASVIDASEQILSELDRGL